MKTRTSTRTKSRRDWHKLIDQFMAENKRSTLDWQTVLGLEGGYGASKIKSVEDAIDPKNEGTWPYIWFKSDQTDISVYKRYDYIYSLLFGRQISSGTIALTAKHIDERAQKEKWGQPALLVDWGGSIFTAVDICDLADSVQGVILVNLDGPQLEFADWFIWENRYPIGICRENEFEELRYLNDRDHPVIFLFSEVLEHEKEPIRYLESLDKVLPLDDLYVASSFCTPAYGHYVPITIRNKDYHTVRSANKAWRAAMEGNGYELTKIQGWNSRLWRCRR